MSIVPSVRTPEEIHAEILRLGDERAALTTPAGPHQTDLEWAAWRWAVAEHFGRAEQLWKELTAAVRVQGAPPCVLLAMDRATRLAVRESSTSAEAVRMVDHSGGMVRLAEIFDELLSGMVEQAFVFGGAE